jgi:hypothetical protein
MAPDAPITARRAETRIVLAGFMDLSDLGEADESHRRDEGVYVGN